MIETFVTGKTSYDQIDSYCWFQSTFTEDFYAVPRKTNQDYYIVELVAINGPSDC